MKIKKLACIVSLSLLTNSFSYENVLDVTEFKNDFLKYISTKEKCYKQFVGKDKNYILIINDNNTNGKLDSKDEVYFFKKNLENPYANTYIDGFQPCFEFDNKKLYFKVPYNYDGNVENTYQSIKKNIKKDIEKNL